MPRRKRATRSKNELDKALESVLYEMVILATAMLLRDRRYFFKEYPDLQWGPPQIAHDVIRLKSRLLFDFFYSKDDKDIIAEDFISFPIVPLDRSGVKLLRKFKDKVNKWTVHLSWSRAAEAEYTKTDRKSMEKCALLLLNIGGNFVDECIASGLKLGRLAKPYHDNFNRLHAYLVKTPRVEEGKGVRPAKPIDLETLSL